ncbi:S8 family serine peptidase [Actinomadura sp. LD22]|uniref:S8 family serine peptidase n=1 Tax=Actinomadura physcomitrii TaxID=2650748 RepID=A0A6I4M498_9ACTN|nr:S8 family serine peptidase [Actinomadura physcomitrii]MVZ98996.1 S8 family serine peptidase [Actinomadura physcomitrii]
MTHRRWSRALPGALLGTLLAAGALAVLPPPPAQAAPAGGLAPGRSWKVTLLTGDVVRVRTAKGRAPMVAVTPAPGRGNHLFRTVTRPDGHVLVTPLDVARLVGPVLDPRLFDVTDLIAAGYDDARSADLPLIVQRGAGARTLSALAGGTMRQGVALPSIGAVAARQPKKDARRLGSSLAAMAGPSLKATGGIRHVWLDGKVKASALPAAPAAPAAKLDGNLEQIGAPKAWKAGYTGAGATVAVLDTGVDATHPDLKGRIAETKDFSGSPDTGDRFGHGTHVAATVAGTGAAAGGARTGVAPGAKLLVGKVLGDDGYGSDSAVIAGMQWAAPRAKIVSMSLGGGVSDGTDPVSQALNGLSGEYGTLFVVAAGNEGTIGSVESPGTADAALTVGAVDGRDRLADFSSRGPRAGGHAAKPEIVAPGVDIVAARAKGTAMGTPLGPLYTRASGTSMATPHVAGAAALLAARHPRWTPAQLKAALVGTAAPATGGDLYERGAGRLDAGAAATGSVLPAQGVVDLGTSAFPQHKALSAKLGWTSLAGAAQAALSVRVVDRKGDEVSGAASLSATRVDVPAGGSASASLTVDAAKLAAHPGLYDAEVTARTGTTSVHTSVTFYVEPPAHTLTVKANPLPGTDPADFSGYAGVVNLADWALFAQAVDATPDGTKVRVPEGRYSVLGTVDDFKEGAWRSALAGTPEVLVDRDMTVTLDGAAAKPVTASVQGVSTTMSMASASVVRGDRQGLWTEGVYTDDPAVAPVYAQPMGGATTGTFRAYTAHRLTAPGEVYDLIHPLGDAIPADPSHVVGAAEKARMARVDQRFAAFDGDTGKGIVEHRYGTSPEGLLLAGLDASDPVESGTARTDYVSTGKGMLWADEASPAAIGDGQWVDELPFTELRPGQRLARTWGRQPVRPGPVAGSGVALSDCTPAPPARTRDHVRVQLVDVQTRIDGFDCGIDGVTGTLALFANGAKIGGADGPSGDFDVPSGAADYRLTYDNDASKALPVSVRTSTAWTFRSATPRGSASAMLPLLLVDYDLGLDLRNQPSGEPAVFSVARVAGAGRAKVTGLRFWTSVDDGATWQAVPVKALGHGRFSAPLPAAVQGQAVSLRVSAGDAGGSGVDQRIIRAYRVR